MADFMMHNTLARQLFKTVPLIEELCLIGAQGPDYTYYVLNKDQRSAAFHLGNTLHNAHTAQFFEELLQYAVDHQSLEVMSYLCGFLTHYALDVAIHPYIYYHTGIYQANDENTRHYAGLHLQFERKVDLSFMKLTANLTLHRHHLLTRVLPLKRFPKTIEEALSDVIEKVYDQKKTGELFRLGYQTMRRVYRIFVHDRTTLKQKMLRLFESYKKPKPLYLRDLSHAQNIRDFDYLNLKKTPWKHPVTGAAHHESVLELFDQAALQARIYLKAAQEAYAQQDVRLLTVHLNNASYDSGLPLNLDQTMRHFEAYNKKTA